MTLRTFAFVLSVACFPVACFGTHATAQGVDRASGNLRAAQLEAAEGFAVVPWMRLRARGTALGFVASEAGELKLSDGHGCEVTLRDRNGDGRFETRKTFHNGVPALSCEAQGGAFRKSLVESGATQGPLRDCLFVAEPDRVLCQPTRFGKPEGESWTMLKGFRSPQGALRGRPDGIAWRDGLVVFDAASGWLLRVVEAPHEEVEASQDLPVMQPLPAKPELLRSSRLHDDSIALTPERQKVLDERNREFGEKAPDRSRATQSSPDSRSGE